MPLKPGPVAYVLAMVAFAAYLVLVDRLWPLAHAPAGAAERVYLEAAGLRASPDVRVHFETIRSVDRDGSQLLSLAGWGLVEGQSNRGKQLVVALRREDEPGRPVAFWRAAVDLTPRRGVADANKGVADDFLGFSSMIDLRELPAGTYRLGLVLVDDAGARLGWTAQHLSRTETAIIEGFVSAPVAATAPRDGEDHADPTMLFHVERLEPGDRTITIAGWAFIAGRDTDLLRHAVVLTAGEREVAFDAATLTRWGVHSLHAEGDAFLAESGFLARVPLSGLEQGVYAVDVIAHDGSVRARGRSQFELELTSGGSIEVHRKW